MKFCINKYIRFVAKETLNQSLSMLSKVAKYYVVFVVVLDSLFLLNWLKATIKRFMIDLNKILHDS